MASAVLLVVLSAPAALALKATFPAERLDTGSEGDQPVHLGTSNVTVSEDFGADEEVLAEAVQDFFPRLNISLEVITRQHQREEFLNSDPNPWVVWNETCKVSREEKCRMSSFRKNTSTMVFPGGATGCMFGDLYAFEVFPGDSDKLLIFFEGGGACWDEATSLYQPACKTFCAPGGNLGPFNQCDGYNPFEHFTVIYVQACTGDLHAGQRDRSTWRNPFRPGVPVTQKGYANARAAVEWAKANTARKLTNLALSGESAGAIGVQMWAATLLREFTYDKASVLSDSYVGVFPRGFQGPVFKDLGACDTGLFSEEVTQWCRLEDTSIDEVYMSAVRGFRNVAFGHVVSKHDLGQMAFYDIARETQVLNKVQRYCAKQGVPWGKKCNLTGAPNDMRVLRPKLIEWSDFHKKMAVVINRLSLEPNYVSYVMSGKMHTITPFIYGNCSWINYNELCLDGFRGGLDGWQRHSIQDWLAAFFGIRAQSAPFRSKCERLPTMHEDDGCDSMQENKVLKLSRARG